MREPLIREPAPPVPLRDGSSVLVRPIRASDKRLIRTAFERLGEDSRYRRTSDPDAAEVAVTVVDDWHGKASAPRCWSCWRPARARRGSPASPA